MISPFVFRRACCICLALFVCPLAATTVLRAQDKDWRPVTPNELQMKTGQVEANADAEALFWEVRVSDEYDGRAGFKTVLNNYLRIKIFTEKGRDEYSKVDIAFGRSRDLGVDIAVRDIAARTVKPDGTTVELKPGDIFERETVKGKGIKFKSKSFVFPGADVGSIVEYRWKEIRGNSLSYYVRLKLAREIPVQFVKYYIKPVSAPYFNLGMRLHWMNTNTGFSKDAGGFYSISMENVPSFKDESSMPSDYEVQPWALVYYEGDDPKASAEAYWQNRGKKTFEDHKSLLQFNDDIRRMAAQTIGDATDTNTRVRLIYQYCRDRIVDVDDDASGLTAEQLKNIRPNKKVSDVIKNGTGTWHDKQMLFGAMVASIGVDVRVANVASRTEPKFDKSLGNGFFNRTEILAAKIGDEWRFFDPSSRYTPYGNLPWSIQGQPALISDARQPFFVDTPIAPPEASLQVRTAVLRLSDDGTLEGDVKIEFTGSVGAYYREINDNASPTEREKSLVDMIKRRTLDAAEITAISIDNVKEADKPFTYAFHIRLPGYTDRTGKRIFLQPNIFERGTGARFVNGDRKFDISFDYGWKELDDVTIELPKGFTSDAAESIPKVVSDDGNLSLDTQIEISKDRHVLKYSRTFVFGSRSTLTYSKNAYTRIKGYFDAIHRSDTRGIMLLSDAK